MTFRPKMIVGLGGTVRPGSSSEKALSLALQYAEIKGAVTKMFSGRDLQIPMYDPVNAGKSEPAKCLVDALRQADGVIISSPCYHGGISGLVKNAIDYAEELRADNRAYFHGRAMGVIGCGYGNQGPGMVLAQLRSIGHALRGWNVPLGVAINSAVVGFDGFDCTDADIKRQIEIMAGQVVDFAIATDSGI